MKIRQEESRIVMSMRQYFDLTYPGNQDDWIRIECGGKRNIGEARALKLEGNKPGTPDILIAFPQGNFHSLWLEVKIAKGKLTTEQRKSLKHKASRGFAVAVAYGVDDGLSIIDNYMSGDHDQDGQLEKL